MSTEYNPMECRANEPKMLPPFPAPQYEKLTVLLASNSPRRRELLGLIVPQFAIAASKDIEEVYDPVLEPEEVPAFLSRLKADAYADDLNENEILITADTVVILDGKILGKPHDVEEANEMLRQLRGKTHKVVTGVTITKKRGTKNLERETFSETTAVTFAEISDAEIEQYVARFLPLDKAGAYGIQEWVGAAAISRIDGCFYNVMGLPLHALYSHLKSFVNLLI